MNQEKSSWLSFLQDLESRGIVAAKTEGFDKYIRTLGPKNAVYMGFDPTADSLHVGNLAAIAVLKLAADYGIQTIAVIGGATAAVGDPSGKTQEREKISLSSVDHNTNLLLLQLSKLLPTSTIVNNLNWYGGMNVLKFLRDIGKEFQLARMMEKESVKRRKETGISFSEFSYQILQAYDFLYLAQEFNCRIQLGGSDQWGNITAGIDLISRKTKIETHGLTTKLLTKTDGSKFGKTESGAVWLDERKTSPYKMWQFFYNLDVDTVNLCWKYFGPAGKEMTSNADLADVVVEWVHGKEKLLQIHIVKNFLYGQSKFTPPDKDLRGIILSEISSSKVPASEVKTAMDVLRVHTFKSNSEARRAITAKAVKINGRLILDSADVVEPIDNVFYIKNGKSWLAVEVS